jgi:hypothetical protein
MALRQLTDPLKMWIIQIFGNESKKIKISLRRKMKVD